MDWLRIICVLRTGGDYNREYVDKLYAQVVGNIKSHLYFDFICLTDAAPWSTEYQIFRNKNLPLGWWSKIDCFRFTGPVIYFDLDTMIVSPIDNFCRDVVANPGEFRMLKSFRFARGAEKKYKYASGVMSWNGDFQFIKNNAQRAASFKNDQEYIQTIAKERTEIKEIQELVNVHSYKHHCKEGVPEDAEIIAFHGHPRPHEINWKLK